MTKYRIDYYHGAWDVAYAKREYKHFDSKEAATAYVAAQGFKFYEIMPVVGTEDKNEPSC